MRRIAVMVVAASFCAANAFGQAPPASDLRAQASQQLHRYCIASDIMAGEADAEAKCQCLAQTMTEDWPDRELTMFLRVFAHYPDRKAARAELRRMIDEEGYTEADYASVNQRLDRAVDAVGERCDGQDLARPE
jgi:hypothetical protein